MEAEEVKIFWVDGIDGVEVGMSNDPLHGVTLERMLTELVEEYGWDDLAFRIRINCFSRDPSIKSSLKFLRRTPWARNKVEILYKFYLGVDQDDSKKSGEDKESKKVELAEKEDNLEKKD